ncbi:MAG: methionine synthase [Spirochaetaceae bacterium]|jgi:5-methyltetrahydrofolate--homocysteine methyltransferase|nr:methionine synthase [Spirochaetaceae bacterium]
MKNKKTNTFELLDEICKQRILVLDGAMGTMVQRCKLNENDFRGNEYGSHTEKLLGCNDILCITKPQIISDIHEQYLNAGCDIIETCSFNANAISLADYGLENEAYRISKEAAKIARNAADKYSDKSKLRFVAGVLGPMTKSASIAPSIEDTANRSVVWDELEQVYYDNACGLLDGGADIFLIETVFDVLNAKAAAAAIMRLFDERHIQMPVMVSAAISDASGRILSGHTVEAFYIALSHVDPWSVGLNCSLGAKLLKPHLKKLANIAECKISVHPNAGLPNELGDYDESPSEMASLLSEYFSEGLVNIAGGCCGSTPEHIEKISHAANAAKPRIVPKKSHKTYLCGFEKLELPHSGELTIIGERGNAPGSKIFLNYIKTKQYEKGLSLISKNIEDGAVIIDICMDDGLLDAEKEIVHFTRMALSVPDIARLPFVIDSSRFNVIEAALKCIAGKVIANSITLKEGEDEFIKKSRIIRRLGAAVMVMLFDETGQADTYEKKVMIAERSYKLLVEDGFPAHDIIFDPNILAVATGMKEHNVYALDFIRACSEILKRCPYSHISAGVSNLSFSFRGNWEIRNAIHSVFLKLAQDAGLSLAIVNTAALGLYDKIDDVLKNAVADMLLNKNDKAAENLLAIAEKYQADHSNKNATAKQNTVLEKDIPCEERIINAMIKGNDENIADYVLELLNNGKTALEIIEGTLMNAMRKISKLFEEGNMFLPQLMRSAGVMKKAAAVLDKYLPKKTSADSKSKKIILATVKGDVHDIGKNIVGSVLACSGFEIIDMGVMVPAEKIVTAAENENAAAIGLSGLVTPSLDEMINVAKLMQAHALQTPLFVGGAATSLLHTALKISPVYNGPVIYTSDAGSASASVQAVFSEAKRNDFLTALHGEYENALQNHSRNSEGKTIISLEKARNNKLTFDLNLSTAERAIPKRTDIIVLNNYKIENIVDHINWKEFLSKWFKYNTVKSAEREIEKTKLLDDAKTMLKKIIAENILTLRGLVKIFPADSDGDDILVNGKRFCFLRSLQKKDKGEANLCLADFVGHNGYIGFFALSAGFGLEDAKNNFIQNNDTYKSILISFIADSLAEAFSAEVHLRVQKEWWCCEEKSIRPAFGYPCCPDHEDKRIVFELLEAEKNCGMSLTETAMINPVSSVCGMYFVHPHASYFNIGSIGGEQLEDWAKRKGISADAACKRVSMI